MTYEKNSVFNAISDITMKAGTNNEEKTWDQTRACNELFYTKSYSKNIDLTKAVGKAYP